MPNYEYGCQQCGKTTEVRASFSEKEKGLKVECGHCGSRETAQVLGGFQFMGASGGKGGGGCGSCSTKGGCSSCSCH